MNSPENERFIGQVCEIIGAYAPPIGQVYELTGVSRAFAGWIYDSTKRRSDTGDMAQDFAFVDFTDHYSSRKRAERELKARLDALNAGEPL